MEQQMRKSITISDQALKAIAKADRARADRRALRAAIEAVTGNASPATVEAVTGNAYPQNPKTSRSDKVIIAAAVAYAQSAAAWRAGFDGDPDGSNENAERLGARHKRARDAALHKLANTPASSAEALDAKARVLPMILDDDCGGVADLSDEFYRAFAADVQKFLEPLISAEWHARNDARDARAVSAAAT
jgi:hypothetical protein